MPPPAPRPVLPAPKCAPKCAPRVGRLCAVPGAKAAITAALGSGLWLVSPVVCKILIL